MDVSTEDFFNAYSSKFLNDVNELFEMWDTSGAGHGESPQMEEMFSIFKDKVEIPANLEPQMLLSICATAGFGAASLVLKHFSGGE